MTTNGNGHSSAPGIQGGVAFVCHPYHRGGVTRWMIDAAAEFHRRGSAVWFVAPEPARPFGSGRRRPTMVSLLRGISPEARPTIVNPSVGVAFELGTLAYRASVYGRAIRRWIPAGTPCIVSDDPSVWKGGATVSDEYPMVGVLHGDDAAYYQLARTHREQLGLCVAVSRRIAERAGREAGVTRLETIPCGIPLSECSVQATALPGIRLIWVGRMEEKVKRVSDLPAIAALLRQQGVAFTLDIVGDGDGEGALRRRIRELDLEKHVHLLGWRDSSEIWRLLCVSDVLLLPSNREGMPLVMMEALAAGCSVVASRVSGVEDAVKDPATSDVLFVHDIGNVVEAARLICRALQVSSADRRERARRAAEAMFSIEACVARYAEALRALRPLPRATRRPLRGSLATTAFSFPLAILRSARRSMQRRRSE